jgi:two-component system phosphate regulon sensor histidine kinase PhoR
MQYYDEMVDIIDLSQKLFNDLDIIARDKWINLELIHKWDFIKKDLKIDPNKLKQILINLINNALKFTNSGGTVRLIINDLWKNILFEVEDTWIWISKEKIDKIFDKFYQVDSYKHRTVEWLGLGLAISQHIIKHYRSKILVESIEWVSTKFFFELPKK